MRNKLDTKYDDLSEQIDGVNIEALNNKVKFEDFKKVTEEASSARRKIVNDKVKKISDDVAMNIKFVNQQKDTNIKQKTDMEILRSMYTEISLAVVVKAKLNDNDKDPSYNLTSIVQKLYDDIGNLLEAKIESKKEDILSLTKQSQQETLKMAQEGTQELKSTVTKFYNQFKTNAVKSLGYEEVHDFGFYLVSDDRVTW